MLCANCPLGPYIPGNKLPCDRLGYVLRAACIVFQPADTLSLAQPPCLCSTVRQWGADHRVVWLCKQHWLCKTSLDGLLGFSEGANQHVNQGRIYEHNWARFHENFYQDVTRSIMTWNTLYFEIITSLQNKEKYRTLLYISYPILPILTRFKKLFLVVLGKWALSSHEKTSGLMNLKANRILQKQFTEIGKHAQV